MKYDQMTQRHTNFQSGIYHFKITSRLVLLNIIPGQAPSKAEKQQLINAEAFLTT